MPAKRKPSKKLPLKMRVYTAPWCGPCRAHKAVVRRVMKRDPAIELEVIDVEEPQNRVRVHGINSVPTTVVLGAGAVLAVAEGEHSVRELQHLIRACRAKAAVNQRAVRRARTQDLQHHLMALADIESGEWGAAAEAAAKRPSFGLEVLELLHARATARVTRTGRGGPTVADLAEAAASAGGRALPRALPARHRAYILTAAAVRAAGYCWHAGGTQGLDEYRLDIRLAPPAA